MVMSYVPQCDPLMQVDLGCVTRVTDTLLLDLLVWEVRPLESFVIGAVLSFWTLGAFDRRVRFSPGTVSAFLGTILGQLYPLLDG